jgi:hypothetical protein
MQGTAERRSMARKHGWVLSAMIALTSLSCEREFALPETSVEVDGYEIHGRITDRFGNPVRDVPIRLYYQMVLVDQNPPPSTEFQVTSASQNIRVVVLDRKQRQRFVLYDGVHPVGEMNVVWNGKDANGADMPSGVYMVHYLVDGQSRKSYPVTVNGTVTARTDSTGFFRIADEHLPVGFYPVPVYSSDGTRYMGSHRIGEGVGLQLVLENLPPRNVFVMLARGVPSRVELSLN